MGYKSFLRSVQAEARRQERAAKRRQRELERRQKEAHKMAELERARLEVEEYENYLEVVTSIHKDCGRSWNWNAIKGRPAPRRPKREFFTKNEDEARKASAEYSPSRKDKILRRAENRRNELLANIEESIAKDEQEFNYAESE